MIIVSIETSCDETSVAFLRDENVISNYTISQILHQSVYDGVVPGLAAKLHVKNIQHVFLSSLKKANISLNEIDIVSYTETPGMIICLQIGKIVAQTISLYLKKPLLSCNHLHGHIFSTLINKGNNEIWSFPSLALVISGGHTQMHHLKSFWEIELIGSSLDDAVGEFIDKSASLMGYGYPGGPIIEELAKKKKNPQLIKLPFPLNDKGFDFSFSGLKSEVRRLLEMRKRNICHFDDFDLAHSIQVIVSNIFVKKISNYLFFSKNIKSLIIGGGVISNSFFRENIIRGVNFFLKKNRLSPVSFFFPENQYSTDNAAMIGILACYELKKNPREKLKLL